MSMLLPSPFNSFILQMSLISAGDLPGFPEQAATLILYPIFLRLSGRGA